ncbi:hypothetical protein chiPu_0033128 [Chiloscyllium punctatum]|uniref:Uncharacterized protein n=1 Tax=Chiloscyllium punctatum TaxID=137246 RepID=A0A401U2G4_CHIPU|nr:hypothetical protein [Chiloscyllium punctatum]
MPRWSAARSCCCRRNFCNLRSPDGAKRNPGPSPRDATGPGFRYAPSGLPIVIAQSSFTRDTRSALPITLTEDSAIAAAPTIGDSRMPNSGYSTPAAIGTPAAL